MKRFYVSAPIDEIGLFNEVREKFRADVATIPTHERLIELTEAHGVDVATAILYLSISEGETHRAFGDAVTRQRVAPIEMAVPLEQRPKLFLVPAMFYAEYPEVGADGEHILAIARRCGFDAERILTASPGPVVNNAELVARTLRDFGAKYPGRPIWVLTMSRGGLELRMAFENHPAMLPLPQMRGWINACGFPEGNSLTDISVSTWRGRLRWWLIGKIIRCPMSQLLQMSEAHVKPYGPTRLPVEKLPPEFKVYNLLPVPLSSHVQTSLVGRFLRLSRLGPNDGITTLRKSIILPGEVFPVLGCDHFFRNYRVVPLLYQLFRQFQFS